MRHLWPFACLWILASGALAQTLPVRSGEHGGFSRLVVDLPGEVAWQLDPQKEAAGYLLRFPDRGFGFDTGTVFDRIGTGRVAAVTSPTPGTLAIDLACDCVIAAQLVGQRMLAMDISAADQPEDTEAATAMPPQPDWASLPRRPDPFERLLVQELEAALPTEEERAIEQAFAEEIASAATYGLLSLNRRPAPAPAPAAPVASPDATVAPQMPETTMEDVARMFLDRGGADRRIRLNGDRCLPETSLSIGDWGGEGSYPQQIGALRTRLTGEFDRPHPETVAALARLYLHVGFGAEARSVLDMADVPEAATLSSLARIIDDEDAGSGVFAGQAHCDTPAAMWAVLGAEPGAVPDQINENAVLNAFESLPPHLKQLLAARLSDGLHAAGATKAARSVLARVKRGIDALPPDIKLAEAQIDAPERDVTETMAQLEEIAETAGPETSAAAVESLISLAAREDRPVAPGMTELASAYVTEYRGTEEAAKLWRAHIRALLSQVRIGEALSEIATSEDIDAQTRDDMRSEVFRALVTRADDVTFLRHVVTDLRPGTADSSDQVLAAAIDRLLTLGLADEAMAAITQLDMPASDRMRQLLTARAHLGLAQPEEAELTLLGLQGDEAQALRIEARLQMGDYAYAADVYSAEGQADDLRQAAWIAGDWQRLPADGEDDPLSEAAQLAVQPTVVPDNTLSATGALADEAAQSRKTLRALLDSTALSPEAAN